MSAPKMSARTATPRDVARAIQSLDGFRGWRTCRRCGHLSKMPGGGPCVDCCRLTIPKTRKAAGAARAGYATPPAVV